MKTATILSSVASMAFFGASVLYSCQSNGLEVNPDESIGALPLTVADPADNPRTPEKVALGKVLFYDPVLSGNQDVACATCHHPQFGYADGLDLPIGVGGEGLGKNRRFRAGQSAVFTRRNTPTLLNVGFNGIDARGQYNPSTAPMFYDLRAQSLEAQSLRPIAAFEEMRGTVFTETNAVDSVLARLRAIPAYQEQFRAVFGTGNAITAQNLGKALAAYERTLVANNAPFDRYRRGDASAMTEAQKRGMVLFIQNGCNACHSGPMFSDYKVHVLGVVDHEKLPESDAGKDNTYAFRTPTLRNVALTAPYMHNGKLASLPDVMTFYDVVTTGEQLNPRVPTSRLDSLLRPRVSLHNDLIQFLNALTDPGFDQSVPANVPSGLSVGGRLR
ncbi:cytochrome c peroxidase [Larkinella sp. VNQ87]|uniref:cytochrome c peroxidase n=1 Tax=Larkinella sp. VNQ87 TaxID=3400921 RepID=UPI003C107F73